MSARTCPSGPRATRDEPGHAPDLIAGQRVTGDSARVLAASPAHGSPWSQRACLGGAAVLAWPSAASQ